VIWLTISCIIEAELLTLLSLFICQNNIVDIEFKHAVNYDLKDLIVVHVHYAFPSYHTLSYTLSSKLDFFPQMKFIDEYLMIALRGTVTHNLDRM